VVLPERGRTENTGEDLLPEKSVHPPCLAMMSLSDYRRRWGLVNQIRKIFYQVIYIKNNIK
jgi:hypothetical protein